MRPGSAVALSPAQNRAGDHITRQRHHSGEAGSVNHKRPAKSDAVLRFSNRGYKPDLKVFKEVLILGGSVQSRCPDQNHASKHRRPPLAGQPALFNRIAGRQDSSWNIHSSFLFCIVK